jgi:16S rRNA (uracil1498-N3)-methyltransferase
MPYFFQENLSQNLLLLSSEEAKHISKSLRLKKGEHIWITNGKGTLAKAVLINIYKDSCEVEIVERTFQDDSTFKKLHLAVAPTKNPDRMEWLVEKAVEIGISDIFFIICDRSERKHVDLNRLHRIAVAALKQSQGTWLPELKTLAFSQLINESKALNADKFIAYCEDKEQAIHISEVIHSHHDAVFLIGPEGDFAPQEVLLAKGNGFQHISLGNKILRTETAALLVGCCFLYYNTQK